MVSRSSLVRFALNLLMVLSFFAGRPMMGASSSGNNIYLAQAAAGAANGADCADALAASWFNNASNWGTGSSQIGPGTTVHLCGTISGAAGASGLTVQGSGSADNPITILFESGSTMSAPYWGGGSGSCNLGDMCTGAITVPGYNYITIDGGNSGIIQNSANGTGLANEHSSVGIFLQGSNLTVRNLTVQNIFMNQGSSSNATDANGVDTADIRIDSGSSNIQISNSTLNNARAGIWADTSGSNVNFYGNTIVDHAWHISLNGSGSPNVYSNQISNWTNWQYPTNSYHTDGIIVYGDSSVLNASIYDNYIYGDLGAGSPTGFIFCTYGVQGNGSGSSCTIYNNLLVGTGYSTTHDQAIYFHSGDGTNTLGPHSIYNNTIVGFMYQIYAETDAMINYTIENNVLVGNGTQWYLDGNNSPLNNLKCDHNIYYGGRGYGPFSWGAVSNGQFSQWQQAGQDPNGSIANPNLDSTYHLASGSPAISVGANLSSTDISSLMVGQASVVGVNSTANGVPRSSSATNWPAGAYGYGSSASPPGPPAGLTATVQ
jgi:hypothetical protein